MSFYNPAVRNVYENRQYRFAGIRKRVLAEYGIVFLQKNESINLISAVQLLPVRFARPYQQDNLMQIDSMLPLVIADLVANAWLGAIHTPKEYLYLPKEMHQPDIENDILYYGNMLREFIESLLYTDIARKPTWLGDKNYSKTYTRSTKPGQTGYDTLFDRLKLRDYLLDNLEIALINKRCKQNGNEITVWVKLKVK